MQIFSINLKLKEYLFYCRNIISYNFSKLDYLAFTLFSLAYILFFFSLEKCTLGEDRCCTKFKWMKRKIFEEVLSCIINIVLFQLMITKKISKLHLIHFVIIFLLFYFYSHGVDFEDHGNYNIKFFFVIVISVLVLFIVINRILLLKKREIIVLVICCFSFLYLLKISLFNYINCNEWPKGLNNTSIENNEMKFGCQIKLPKFCPYKIGKYFLDRNRYFSLDCKNEGYESREKILKYSKSPYINKNTTIIGFPLVNKDEIFFKALKRVLFKEIYFNSIIDMDNSTLLDSLKERKPEISIDFSKNKKGEININLFYNETLSKERKKLEGNITPYSNNIMILYLDSVSRASSIRQLKKTLTFFEKFMLYKGNNNPQFPLENFHSFQFFKYHSFQYFTIGNYPILFYGNFRNKKNKLITSYLKQVGFVTGYTSDDCFFDFVRNFHNYTFDEAYDHQYVICDKRINSPNSKLKCFFGKLHIEHMLEYINQFWRKYKNNRKFTSILTNFAHEGSLERLKYIDNIIYDYFNNLYNDNLLKDTTIFLLSDHGVAIPSIYYLNDFFKYERVLPMFYLFVNDRKNTSYESQYKFLNQNQQVFITGFDIYNTIVHLAFGDKLGTNKIKQIIPTNYGKSLFKKINMKYRNPKKYKLMARYACK